MPKVILAIIIALFAGIGLAAWVKKGSDAPTDERVQTIVFGEPETPARNAPVVEEEAQEAVAVVEQRPLPTADRMEQLFNTGQPKLPIVETVSYSRKAPWMEGGKYAWVVDYANHYNTSRHFIARSLHGRRDYEDQRVANGDRFNVFKADYPISFHVVVDHSHSQMWVYYLDETTDERVLLKTYPVGLGRPATNRASGSLTPVGTYKLGEKVAVYRKGNMGLYGGDKTEMVRVFGTRWIPFDEEVGDCTAPAKGLGLHGCPWVPGESGELVEDLSGLGEATSDGCIRLKTDDIEELFAVIISKPTTLYIVRDFWDAKLPGRESE